MRCALIWDKQTNGVAPTEAMIQETPAAGNETITGMPNFNFRDRLVVLYDRVHVLNGLENPMVCSNFSIDLTGKKTAFIAGAGSANDTAQIISGGLFWYVKSDGNNISSNALQYSLYYHP